MTLRQHYVTGRPSEAYLTYYIENVYDAQLHVEFNIMVWYPAWFI